MKWNKILAMGITFILLPIVFGNNTRNIQDMTDVERSEATPVVVSKENPFYALIATPVALYYDNGLHIQPLLVENITNPSLPIKRFEDYYDLSNAIIIANKDIEEASIELAEKIWNKSSKAMVIENSYNGYKLGVAIASLASYENMPIFVTNDTGEIDKILKKLGVEELYIVGNVKSKEYKRMIFENEKEIRNFMINYVKNKFGSAGYIVITNPKDVKRAKVLDSIEYKFKGYVNSGSTLHGLHILLTGMNYSVPCYFEVPPSYKHARIKIDLINLDSQNVEKWGDRLFLHLTTPDNITFVYTSTAAGIPDVKNGSIVKDKLHFETCVYNLAGIYRADVMGTWIMQNKGRYALNITVEKIDDTSYSLMHDLSSLASYLAAYHHGIVFASPHFAFAGNESVGIGGIAYPVKNEHLVEQCNEHVMAIHDELNGILSQISGKEGYQLWQYYSKNPIYIAILGDATMVPMFYYYNPDSDYLSGQGAASDFIYGDIDPSPNDMENDSYTYYPTMENAVGRLTGYDSEDCSALIARTIFYNEIISQLGDWKRNATVQTGTGIEFQKIPIITPLSNVLKSFMGFGPVRDEPTKFFTGESKFINMRISHDFATHGFNVKSAYRLEAQREGVIMQRNGGKYQLESNYIFAFDHGTYYLYEAGDMLDFDQLGMGLKTGLSGKGSFDVRHVVNMEYKPSVAFIESCLVGKIEGLLPQNCVSQAYIHAGVNAFVASTRYTADPGYLEPGLIMPGFGFYGYFNATKNLILHGNYPDLHFGALLAEQFILNLFENESTGMALRNAKNVYLYLDANSTFLWTPPLYAYGPNEEPRWNSNGHGTKVLDKKYVCLHEFTLYGDPAFNPWN
ncbi:MAG: hypothetical protein FE044_00090 [Thermoplasmata archaeon]|nr:MAG: hypothetical protein FE044_00090 [Thermoplasmata archaeon]